MILKGIVEGFYGRPFSVPQRRALFSLLSGVEGAAWMYAPKDDPWHRLKWRERRSGESAAALDESIRDASSCSVRFIFALSPWKFAPGEHATARDIFLEFLDKGVRGLAILFDDIGEGPSQQLAARQAEFAASATEGIAADIFVCPSVYCSEQAGSPGAQEYLSGLARLLPGGMTLLWTGDDVVSKELGDPAAAAAETLLGRPPALWDNLLADDYALRRVFFASPAGRPAAGLGYFLNPSSCFPVAASAVLNLARVSGREVPWPEEIFGRELPGWATLASFHSTPWGPGPEGRHMIAMLRASLRLGHPDDAISLLFRCSGDLAELMEALPELEGGYDLLPVLTDTRRMMHIWIKALQAPVEKRREVLRHHLFERLPYEHPLAEATRRCAGAGGA